MISASLQSIKATLQYLASEGARIEHLVQDINHFGVVIAGAEACTFWVRDGDYMLVRENTAYPVCRTRTVPGARLRVVEKDRPGLTAYMAYQFFHHPEGLRCFNFCAEDIRTHQAYRQADKEPYFSPYFPISKTSLSLLCVPVRMEGEFVGMIKAENRLSADGSPSGDRFTEGECDAFIEYAAIIGGTVMPVAQKALLSDV